MTTACTNCVRLAEKVAELETQLSETRCELEEVTAYAGIQHDLAASQAKTIEQLTTGRSSHDGSYG